jgi:hypothetical protein
LILSARFAVVGLSLLCAVRAGAADPFPTRGGESGLLDVPDADTAPLGAGRIAAELVLDRARGGSGDVTPLPISLVTGFGRSLEVGLAARQWGMPGDPHPSPTLFTGAMKLRLVDDTGWWPAFAVDAYADRFNWRGVAGSRLIASTPEIGRVRLAGYVGAEAHGPRPLSLGPTAGLAIEIIHRSNVETVFEGVAGPRGPIVGGALRWGLSSTVGLSIGASWLPSEGGLRVSLGLGIASSPPRARRTLLVAAPPKPTVAAAPKKPEEPTFADARPRFRLRLASAAPAGETGPRHVHYAAAPDSLRANAKREGPRRAVASAEQLRQRDLDAQAEGIDQRENWLRSADGALANRQDRLLADARRLEARQTTLLARGAALDARENQIRAAGTASERELQIAEMEDQLRSAERELGIQERQASEAVDGAARRERTAAAREEEQKAALAKVAGAPAGTDPLAPAALDARARLLAAREAQLAALEARLSAARERLEHVDRVQRARSDRLDAFDRRLSAKDERIRLLDGRSGARSAEQRGASTDVSTAAPAAPAAIVLGPVQIQRAAGGASGAPAPGVERLPEGPTARRRLRDAFLQYRADLERCAGADQARLAGGRVEAVVRMTVDVAGRVTRLDTVQGDLGAAFDGCARTAAQRWQLPAGEPEYTADLPLTLVGGGTRP